MTDVTIRMSEWDSRDPAAEPALAGLHLDDSRARRTAQSLSAKGWLEVIELASGLSIKTTSFVGSVPAGVTENCRATEDHRRAAAQSAAVCLWPSQPRPI